jgi:heterotetrameric sarcosine oxidase gamma subunit
MNALAAPVPLAPLAQAGISCNEFATGSLRLEERVALTLVRVHSLGDLPREFSGLAQWPQRTGDCGDGDPAVCCLGPREWLLCSESIAASILVAQIERVADQSSCAVCDVSDGFAAFRLSGAAAPWLLAKVCSLDVLGDAAGGSWCRRSRIGKVAAILRFRGSTGGQYDLIVDRSLARYLWELLLSSASHADELARAHGAAA